MLISAVISIIFGGGLYYFWHPPINLSSVEFWLFFLILFGVFFGGSCIFTSDEGSDGKFGVATILGTILVVILILFMFLGLCSSALFRAHDLAGLIDNNINTKDISEYTPSIYDVPLMDKDTAELLMNRQMGSLVDEVSQFDLDTSSQINYQNIPIRVAPLKYSSFFKWLNNKNDGIPSYITVDMTTQQTVIHRLEKGIRFSPSGFFGDDLRRHLQFKYPTVMMSEPVFEIDDEGCPYWVVSKLVHRVGLFGGTDVDGIIIVDAVTGDIEDYSMDEIPEYIDNACPTDTLIELFNYYGAYQDGFLNSFFGQKGVIKATDGYNYIPENNDIWVYTGVTSVVNDESNVGFIYINKRTKEIEYYEVPGAEEFSAMASAEGVVQHLGYTATFPLLLQIEGQPTYCVALKDAGGLVKMYGLVNMSQYQIVVTGETINSCLSKYRTALLNNGQSVTEISSNLVSGIIEDVRTANKDGTTYFYVKLKNNPVYYSFSVIENENIILVNIEDSIKFNVAEGLEGAIVRASLVS